MKHCGCYTSDDDDTLAANDRCFLPESIDLLRRMYITLETIDCNNPLVEEAEAFLRKVDA